MCFFISLLPSILLPQHIMVLSGPSFDSESTRKEAGEAFGQPDVKRRCLREGSTNSVVESDVTCHLHNAGQLWSFTFKKD